MDWKIEVVQIPVADVDRAKAFYARQAGFAVDLDTEIGPGRRIVQLTPPGSGCSIQVSAGLFDAAPGSVQGIQIVVPDIEAARADLAARGVAVSPVRHFADGEWRDGHGGRWNAFAFFADPDGNGWVLQERPTEG
jgi:catechol 2,3-dioxygenase-like lactoylglutathione lyase family enzyme